MIPITITTTTTTGDGLGLSAPMHEPQPSPSPSPSPRHRLDDAVNLIEFALDGVELGALALDAGVRGVHNLGALPGGGDLGIRERRALGIELAAAAIELALLACQAALGGAEVGAHGGALALDPGGLGHERVLLLDQRRVGLAALVDALLITAADNTRDALGETAFARVRGALTGRQQHHG